MEKSGQKRRGWLLWRHGKSAASPRRRPIFIPPLPGWIAAASSETLDQAAFRSGAALAHLQQVLALDAVPQPLLRDRLALMAAETCVSMTGRREDQASLRDVAHLTRPGDHPVPRA